MNKRFSKLLQRKKDNDIHQEAKKKRCCSFLKGSHFFKYCPSCSGRQATTVIIEEEKSPSSQQRTSRASLWDKIEGGGNSKKPRRCQYADTISTSYEESLSPISSDSGSGILDLNDAEAVLHQYMEHQDQANLQEEEDVRFLSAISYIFMDTTRETKAQKSYSKCHLAEAIVKVMRKVNPHQMPASVLSCSLVAVTHLSKVHPPLPVHLEDKIIDEALHLLLNTDDEEGDIVCQELYTMRLAHLKVMIKALLDKETSIEHVLRILKHIQNWVLGSNGTRKHRAIHLQAFMLHTALTMPGLEKCDLWRIWDMHTLIQSHSITKDDLALEDVEDLEDS